MNSVQLIGRLVRDPDLRYTNSGTAYVRVTVATDRKPSKDKKAEAEAAGQPTADFISCIAWSKTAELISQYFSKGSKIGLNGRIQTGSYEKDGRTIYTTDVLIESIDFLESKKFNTESNQSDDNEAEFFPVDNDDIPF